MSVTLRALKAAAESSRATRLRRHQM
jgi:hypothetical protein